MPVLWWRSVGSTHTAHATEHMIDILAKEAGKDPLAFRLAMLKDKPRHAGVLKLAAEKAGWGQAAGEGRASRLSRARKLLVLRRASRGRRINDDGTFKVKRVVCAIDCGVAVNPDVIAAQMEGGIGYGLGAALKGAITLKDGAVEQSNFHDYEVLRMSEMPQIEVHIVPSTENPTGVGEPGTPGRAAGCGECAALGNGRAHQRAADVEAGLQGAVVTLWNHQRRSVIFSPPVQPAGSLTDVSELEVCASAAAANSMP